jgi:hypothetical protein
VSTAILCSWGQKGSSAREGTKRLLRGAVEMFSDPKYPEGCYATKEELLRVAEVAMAKFPSRS